MREPPLSLDTFMQLVRDEQYARALFLAARYPNGTVCPACDCVGNATALSEPLRFRCRACGKKWSARSGTPMEQSHLSVRTWLIAMFLMAYSSKGISARQLGFRLGLQYRTAWHLSHRVRRMIEADDPVLREVIELDETYVGGEPRPRHTGDDDSDNDDTANG